MLTLEENDLYLKWLNSWYVLYVQTFPTKGFLIWIFPAQHREVELFKDAHCFQWFTKAIQFLCLLLLYKTLILWQPSGMQHLVAEQTSYKLWFLTQRLQFQVLFILICCFFCTWRIIAISKSCITEMSSSGYAILSGKSQVCRLKTQIVFLFHLRCSKLVLCHN